MGSGVTATVSIVVHVSPSAAAGSTISNTAIATHSSVESNNANNSSIQATTVTTKADLAVTKSGPATANPGTIFTYNVGLTNNGPSDATAVTLTDPLPAATSFVSEVQSTGPAFTCTIPPGPVTCTIASLAAGATATFSIQAKVLPTAPAGNIS